MKSLVGVALLAVLATSCGSRAEPIPADLQPERQVQEPAEGEIQSPEVSAGEELSAGAPTSIPEEAPSAPTPVLVPTLPAPVVAYEELEATVDAAAAADLGVFAQMPENVATGELAPDFVARALGDRTFKLSEARGSFVLVYPTVVGCGDCVFTMSQLAAAYPDYQDANLELVVMNLYPEDVPESWSAFIELYPQLDAVWSVVDSIDFVVEYEVRSLGTILLIDPEGKLVYRSNWPLVEEEFRQLFALVRG